MEKCREPGTVGDPDVAPSSASEGYPCQVCHLPPSLMCVFVSRQPDRLRKGRRQQTSALDREDYVLMIV